MAIKRNNDVNENWKLVGPEDHIRRRFGAYRSTCRPAAF
jgi:hypothetical protein